MPLNPHEGTMLLNRALEEEIGIYVRAEDAKATRMDLLNIKRAGKDPQWDRLTTFVVEQDLIFIVKKDVEL